MAAPRRVVAFVSLALLGAAVAHAGGLYQWKDAHGVTHYSDAPPAKGQYRARTVHVRESEAPVPATGNPATAATTTPKPAAKEIAARNCTVAKTNLDRLDAGGDIGLDANGDGKPDAPLSADERAKQKGLAETGIKTYCGSTATP